MNDKQHIRIGGGAGFAGDRLEPAVLLVREGKLDYLVLECLAERTIALAQQRKLQDPDLGYDSLLDRRMRMLLPELVEHKVRLVTNLGAANAPAAAQRILELAREMQLDVSVAAVTGDDVLDQINPKQHSMEGGRPLETYGRLISANAYLGVDAILPALEAGVDIVVTGRVADPSLFLAPLMHEFGWSAEDVYRLGQGTVVGHLLECGAQICGGYFMDPGKKDVPNPAWLGFPIAEVARDGTAVISKVAGTGGRIDRQTATEQLLYEVTDPYAYLTPDVTADFTTVQLEESAPDEVTVSGGGGTTRPDQLKVSVGYSAGYRGEGEISYAGPNAIARARLAGEIVRERLSGCLEELRIDLIGVQSVYHGPGNAQAGANETRLRVAGTSPSAECAALVGEEVEALYTNGPAGGGGARKSVSKVVGIVSVLLDRTLVHPEFTIYHT